MCGLPLWALHGIITGVCSCGLAVPLLYLSGKDAMLFIIVASITLSLFSTFITYYALVRFVNVFVSELIQIHQQGDLTVHASRLQHRLVPLAKVRETRNILKHFVSLLKVLGKQMKRDSATS
eukprot:PhF_6_TR3221/c0_g1_i1/m.4602